MLDYYSEFPHPPISQCIKEVADTLKLSMNDKVAYELAFWSVNDTDVKKGLGSLTGWNVFFRDECVKKALIKYNNSICNKYNNCKK